MTWNTTPEEWREAGAHAWSRLYGLVLDGLRMDNGQLDVRPTRAGPEELLGLAGGPRFDQAIVLGYREELTPSEADARTLLTLLTLRKVFPVDGDAPMRIVAEVLDRANVAIAVTAGVDDFIVSDELTSLMIAQLSERAELQHVFADLFDAEGAHIVLRPAALYAGAHPVSVAALRVAANRRGETAMGFRLAATGEVRVNPPRDEVVDLGPGDEVLVLAVKR